MCFHLMLSAKNMTNVHCLRKDNSEVLYFSLQFVQLITANVPLDKDLCKCSFKGLHISSFSLLFLFLSFFYPLSRLDLSANN